VKAMLMNERNIAAEIDVATRMLPEGLVEVQATVGPNVFLWAVNPDQKTYEAKNDLTRGFTQLVLKANA
jgi:hypothetical protein